MNTRLKRPLQRMTATATALALLLGTAGCASPYHFSSRLDTRLPADGGEAAPANTPLAGDLHLSLAALMGQRRQLWQAAGETELMKNATAFGLIALGAAAFYRGTRYTDNKGWMQRAGLIGAATYAGATWLEPSARQSIYLQGAMSLTCLALATAPYEMTTKDYEHLRAEIIDARKALESLASELRLVGRYRKKSETWWVVRGGWNKLRWANRVLDSADVALGNIEQAGPRLRDMTALMASEVATQVNRVSKDLSELPGAIATLKPNVAKLVGADVFAPPKKEDVDQNPPATDDDDDDDDETTKQQAGNKATNGVNSPPKDPQCGSGASAPATPAATAATKEVRAAVAAASLAASAAQAAASAASAAVAQTQKKAPTEKKPKEVKAATAAASAASAAEAAKKEAEAQRRRIAADLARKYDLSRANELRKQLTKITGELDKHLGPVASFVQRVASARDGLDLPKGCGPATVVKLVPDKRELVLQPGETFQFLLEGDSGKAAASYLGLSLAPDVLDIAMPLVQSNSSVRLTAGTAAPRAVSTTVRISDSRRELNFDITVKVCPASGP